MFWHGSMDAIDVALLLVVGYVATTTLVRLMIRYRDQLLERFRLRVTAEEPKRRPRQQQKDKAA